MTFEERMERLAERHEALAQTVEMHNAILLRLEATEEHDRAMMQSLTDRQAELTVVQRELMSNHQREMLDGLLLATDRVLKATGHVVLVAGRYDARISTLEK